MRFQTFHLQVRLRHHQIVQPRAKSGLQASLRPVVQKCRLGALNCHFEKERRSRFEEVHRNHPEVRFQTFHLQVHLHHQIVHRPGASRVRGVTRHAAVSLPNHSLVPQRGSSCRMLPPAEVSLQKARGCRRWRQSLFFPTGVCLLLLNCESCPLIGGGAPNGLLSPGAKPPKADEADPGPPLSKKDIVPASPLASFRSLSISSNIKYPRTQRATCSANPISANKKGHCTYFPKM